MAHALKWIARLIGGVSLAVLLLWLVGRLASDRTLPTQFIAWIPTWMLVGAGAAFVLIWFFAAMLHRWAMGIVVGSRGEVVRPPRLAGSMAARPALLLLLASFTWLAFVDLRLQNRFLHRPLSASIGVTHWNATGARTDEIVGQLMRTDADLAIVVNAGNPVGLPGYMNSIREKTLEPCLVRADRFLVASRYPIKRWAVADLAIEPARSTFFSAKGVQQESGRALYLEIDAFPLMPKPLRVWALDLPSDPNLHRWEVAQQVAVRLERYQGTAHLRQPSGQYLDEPMAGGFPLPDIIVGDLNIPRGSASLGIVAEGMANAFDQAGHGLVASYPRERPLLHLDQMFIGPQHRAIRYGVHDGDSGFHRLQSARVIAVQPAQGNQARPSPGIPAPAHPPE